MEHTGPHGGSDSALTEAAAAATLGNNGQPPEAPQEGSGTRGSPTMLRTQQMKLLPQTEEERRTYALDMLEYSEVEGSVFVFPKILRTDLSSLFDRIVEAVIIILAVQHATFISHTPLRFYLNMILILLACLSSQLTYKIESISRVIAYVRNRRTREEDMHGTQHQQQQQQQQQQQNHALTMLLESRLSGCELAISIARKILYFANTYVTFLLVKAVIAWLDISFSNGMWLTQKTIVLILFVVPLFVEFAVDSYHQEYAARASHLKSD